MAKESAEADAERGGIEAAPSTQPPHASETHHDEDVEVRSATIFKTPRNIQKPCLTEMYRPFHHTRAYTYLNA